MRYNDGDYDSQPTLLALRLCRELGLDPERTLASNFVVDVTTGEELVVVRWEGRATLPWKEFERIVGEVNAVHVEDRRAARLALLKGE